MRAAASAPGSGGLGGRHCQEGQKGEDGHVASLRGLDECTRVWAAMPAIPTSCRSKAEWPSSPAPVAASAPPPRGCSPAPARSVALLDLDAAGVTQTAEQIGLSGGEALPFTTDITDAFAVERTFDRVAEEWGRFDVLVNNAGALRRRRSRTSDATRTCRRCST